MLHLRQLFPLYPDENSQSGWEIVRVFSTKAHSILGEYELLRDNPYLCDVDSPSYYADAGMAVTAEPI